MKENNESKSPVPGPGKYDNNTSTLQVKKITLGAKLKAPEKKGPGPADYSPTKSYTSLKYA